MTDYGYEVSFRGTEQEVREAAYAIGRLSLFNVTISKDGTDIRLLRGKKKK